MFQRETTDSLQDTFSCVLLRAREDALKTLFWNQYIRGETIVKTNKDPNASHPRPKKKLYWAVLVSTEETNKTEAPKYNMKLQKNIWKKEKEAYMHGLKFHFLFLWSSQKKKKKA